MAVPGSGELSLGKIRQELQTANYAGGPFTSAATSLDDAENGTITTINKCSALYPLSANPASMSEWYGYDHDAPCNKATASFYFDGGVQDTDELVSEDVVSNNPFDALQADLQNKWTLSMWVRIDRTLDPSAGDEGYQRGYGLYWIEDQDNGYLASIQYIPQSTTGNYNELQLVIATSSGSNNFRSWNIEIDNPSGNSNITGVQENINWSNSNKGTVNTRDFTHLVFVYDDTQGTNTDKFVVYWNGDLLETNAYNTGGGGSGPTGIPYNGRQYAHFGIGPIGGLTSPYKAPWYGWIGWMSYCNNFAADQTSVDTLYNSGTTPAQGSITGLDPNMIHYEFGGNVDPQFDYNGLSITLDVITATWDNSIFP
jgi:hypothetical protein